MSRNKTLLIAGHAPGLGEALQARFEADGYTVVGVSRHAAAPWAADLSDSGATAALFRRLDRDRPPLAGVIHNAMQFHRQAFLETSADTLQSVWQSTVLTAFNVSQAVIPRLRAGQGGALIFSGATGSRRAGPQFSAFSSVKFALRGLAQALAHEHGPDGIHVAHVVIDGLVRSERTARRFAQARPDQMISPDTLAEQYFHLFHQPRNSWTHELDIRPMPAAR